MNDAAAFMLSFSVIWPLGVVWRGLNDRGYGCVIKFSLTHPAMFNMSEKIGTTVKAAPAPMKNSAMPKTKIYLQENELSIKNPSRIRKSLLQRTTSAMKEDTKDKVAGPNIYNAGTL